MHGKVTHAEWNITSMIPQSVLIGLIVAVLGYFLQQRAWKHKTFEETRQREFEECMKLIDALSKAIDKRLMAIAIFRAAVDADEVKPDDLTEYRQSVKDWMHEFSTFKSKLYHFFGRDAMLDFENSVHAQLREVSDILLRTNKLKFSNLNKRDQREHLSVRVRENLARHTAFKYLRELNEQLANEEIGRTKLYNNIDVGDLDLISRTYLVQRLFGLKP